MGGALSGSWHFSGYCSPAKAKGAVGAIIAHGMALTLLRGHSLGQPATYKDLLKIPCGSWAIVDVATAQLIQDFRPIETELSESPDKIQGT